MILILPHVTQHPRHYDSISFLNLLDPWVRTAHATRDSSIREC